MSAWSAVLRIARRDALRAKGRSALVIAMIALPVMGVTGVDVAVRTAELSPKDRAERTLGQADARLSDSGMVRTDQFDQTGAGPSVPRPAGSPADLTVGLPPGARGLPDATTSGLLQVPGRVSAVTLRELAYADPLARGIYRPREGRAPAAAGEVAITDDLAARLDLAVGDRVRLAPDGPEQAVVGVVADGGRTDTRTVLVPGGTLPAGDNTVGRYLLVDLPTAVDEQYVRVANQQGITVEPRDPALLRPAGSGGGSNRQVLLILVLVAGMALLEVVLLAGPAFAVGARRSQAQLALLSATGGQARDVRRTVLAGGLVLGAAAGVVGVVAGIGASVALLPLSEHLTGQVPGPLDIRPLEVLAIALLGVGTALLAAVVPARNAARQDVLAALTGRRGVLRGTRRLPVLGLLAAAAGAAVALHGAARRDPVEVLAGSVLAELGLVATTPALVGLAGRLSPRLPAAPRLALRDAARNRGRTAPAVAAVLAAVAGSVAVGTYVASLDRHDEQAYRASAPAGAAVLSVYSDQQRQRLPQATTQLRATLPAAGVTTLRAIDTNQAYVTVEAPPANRCPTEDLVDPTYKQHQSAAAGDPRCHQAQEGRTGTWYALPNQLVGDPALLRELYGQPPSAELTRVLNAGGVLVNDPLLLDDGTVTVAVQPAAAPDDSSTRRVRLPAAVLPTGTVATLYSTGAARTLGVPVTPTGALVALSRTPTGDQQARAQDALAAIAIDSELYIERGYVSGYGIGLLALVLVSAVLVLGASGIATGLAAADGRSDLATLAAIGASPGLRRRLAAFQSAVIAGLGTLLGVAAGLVPAIALLRALGAHDRPYPIVLPWTNLLITATVVPLLAALAAALLTRSQLPLVRRST